MGTDLSPANASNARTKQPIAAASTAAAPEPLGMAGAALENVLFDGFTSHLPCSNEWSVRPAPARTC